MFGKHSNQTNAEKSVIEVYTSFPRFINTKSHNLITEGHVHCMCEGDCVLYASESPGELVKNCILGPHLLRF